MPTKDQSKIILTFSGKDTPGITAKISEIISAYKVEIHDIDQNRSHDILSLFFALSSDAEIFREGQGLLRELNEVAQDFQLSFHYKFIESEFKKQTPSRRFVLTLLSSQLSAEHIHKISQAISAFGVNIDRMRKLNQGFLKSLEILAYAKQDCALETLKESLLKIAGSYDDLDIAVQRENLYRRNKRLIVMDMDSTLIQVEVIDELAKHFNVGDQVAKITERAMAGEIDFNESLTHRVSLLKGLSAESLEKVAQSIPLTNGAELLIKVLKKLGYKIAVISGGFDYFTNFLKKKLDLDFVRSNRLEIKDGILTGKVIPPIVNAEKKADLLAELASEMNISLESVIAIGDGANDIPMLKKAGLGIAFKAKKKTQAAASASINQNDLAAILYLLGINDEEIEELDNLSF